MFECVDLTADDITAIATIIGLLLIWAYTRATYGLLRETRRPVVCFTQHLQQAVDAPMEFAPWIANVGQVHAVGRFRVTIFDGNEARTFPVNHPYGGEVAWPVHATGDFEFGFLGMLGLHAVAREFQMTLNPNSSRVFWMKFEGRAIRSLGRNRDWHKPDAQIPTVYWTWDRTRWIQDMNPPELLRASVPWP